MSSSCLRVVRLLCRLYRWIFESDRRQPPPIGFRFLELPFVAQKEVLKTMNPFDLMIMSMKCVKFREIQRAARVAKVKSVEWEVYEKYLQIKITFAAGAPQTELNIYYRATCHDELLLDEEELEEVELDELTLHVRHLGALYVKMLQRSTTNGLPREVLHRLFDIVSEVFPTSHVKLNTHNTPIETIRSIFDSGAHLQTVKLDGREHLRLEDVLFIFGHPNCQRLFFRWALEEVYGLKVPLKHKDVQIDHAAWIAVESLLEMDCATFRGNELSFTWQHVNAFVRKWMGGGFERLKSVDFSMKSSLELTDCLRGVESTEWADGAREKYRFSDAYETGREIRRGDGRVATVAVLEQSFTLVVHDS